MDSETTVSVSNSGKATPAEATSPAPRCSREGSEARADVSGSLAFFVAAEDLQSPAAKPRHLEARAEHRSPLLYSASDNRAAFLDERRSRLRAKLKRIEEVLEQNQQRLEGQVTARREGLLQKLQEVERNKAKLQELELEKKKAKTPREQPSKRLRYRTSSSTGDQGDEALNAEQERSKREAAARVLQAVWRQQKYSALVREMAKCKLSLSSARETAFAELVDKIQQPSTIKAMARFLLGVKSASPESARVDFKNPARVFLSAYVIVGHTSAILHQEGPAETAIKSLAEKMLESFELLATEVGTDVAPKDFSSALLVFLGLWVQFYEAFEEWKREDTHKVVGEFIAHWLDLERLWLSVRAELHADVEWHGRVEKQQDQIRSRIKQIAGDDGIARLVAAADRARAELGLVDEDLDAVEDAVASAPQDLPGRLVASPPGSPPRKPANTYSSSPKRFPSSNEKRASSARTDSVTSSRNGSVPNSPSRNLSRSSSFAAAIEASVASGARADVPNPGGLNDMREIWASLAAMPFGSNEQLAHELVMDPDFQLQSPKRSALEEGIRSAARRAFFDAVREDFAVGEYGRYAVGLIDEAKKALISMLRENGSVAQQINEVLDLELISQQISRRIYDMRQSTGFILGKMLQLCAPARDGAIRDLVAIVDSDLAGAWDGLLTTLDDMKLDLANFRLQQLRPQLATEAVSYESRKFDEALEAGRVTLHRTREWLQSAAMSLLTVAAARNPESSDAVAAPRFEDVYNEGLLSLVFGSTAVNAVNCPETLSLDADRIFGMQNEGQAITIVAALLVLSKNLIAELRSNDAAAGRLKSRLMTLLRDPDGGTTVDNLSVELVATMNAILAEKSAGSRLAAEQEALVKSMVDKTLTYKDTVFTMMSRRVQDRVRQTLQSGTLPTAQSLVSSGLDAVAAEVSDLCKKVTRLARHDREVHAKHYDAIIRAALSS